MKSYVGTLPPHESMISWDQFNSSVHLADVSCECYTVRSESEEYINEGRVCRLDIQLWVLVLHGPF